MFFFFQKQIHYSNQWNLRAQMTNAYKKNKKNYNKMQLQTKTTGSSFIKKNAKYVIQIIVWSIEKCHYPYKLYTFSF